MKNIILSTLFCSTALIAAAQKPIEIGDPQFFTTTKVLIKGKVVDYTDNEGLVGVNIVLPDKTGVTTNADGEFELSLNRGQYTLHVSFIGYETLSQPIIVYGPGLLRIRLKENLMTLSEVVVSSAKPDENVSSSDLGKNTLSIETIEALPPFVGEIDILKSITLLPGVSTVGEASSGFHVRGGGSDQNLILLGGAPLYNPSHLFGFFTAFNSDIISNVTLYKGGIPANYGGRGSSILDLTYKTGSKDRWSGKASLGLVSAKVSADGPIVRNKLSLLFAGRTSYSNWILKSMKDPYVSHSSAFFYDMNAVLHYTMNENNELEYSFYRSNDAFQFASDTSFAWSNQSHVLKFKHAFSPRLVLNSSLVYSGYSFDIVNDSGFNNFDLESQISDLEANLDATYDLNEKNEFLFGIQGKRMKIDPGTLTVNDPQSSISPQKIENENSQEYSGYLEHNIDLGWRYSISYGVRYTLYQYLGKKTVYEYIPDFPRNEIFITGSKEYAKNKVIQTYDGFEPRFSFRVSLDKTTSFKAGYNRMYQYIQLISNTTTIAPTDIWKLSDSYLKPGTITQYSLGFFKNFDENSIETSVEGYYKSLDNIVEYKDGAQLLLNNHIETELLSGRGEAYGVELYVKKKTGRMTGWVSYTYSRSFRKVSGAYPETTINNGDPFPSNFDKPHDLTAVMEFNISKDSKFSTIFTYSTGRAVTYPSAKFYYHGTTLAYFADRNGNRAPDYHRLDVSLTFKLKSKRKLLQGDWVLSVYNVYGRKNAFSVFFRDVEGSPPQAYKLSVLGIPFPSLSYNFEF